ncbi:hypothetical protein XELAEV_18021483mg [Xenopus laevis]|uniref:Uncharacterized protein n=1 Tax=Xenopus laevis TaxID=8355 RepID=A0A974HRM1_XENLA|nr:hypothetical protein XELAEV_18021483mg [Xenopus laevis]
MYMKVKIASFTEVKLATAVCVCKVCRSSLLHSFISCFLRHHFWFRTDYALFRNVIEFMMACTSVALDAFHVASKYSTVALCIKYFLLIWLLSSALGFCFQLTSTCTMCFVRLQVPSYHEHI